MTDSTKLTGEAHARLQTEIAELEGPRRREIADRIGIAREWGDLKENAEYHAAKEEAAMLEAKIVRVRAQLNSAEIVEAAAAGEGAGMGSTVTYADEHSGEEMRFKLVSGPDARPGEGSLSIDSPVGRVLAGCVAGDTRSLETPSGARTLRVVSVEHG